jgi:hypothetical protein
MVYSYEFSYAIPVALVGPASALTKIMRTNYANLAPSTRCSIGVGAYIDTFAAMNLKHPIFSTSSSQDRLAVS